MYYEYLLEQFDTRHDFGLEDHLLMFARTGSWAYNTFGEGSDLDFTAICVPRMRHIIGLGTFDGWQPQAGTLDHDLDMKVYTIEKLMRLLLKSNPNSLELLFFRKHLYEQTSPQWDLLRKNRDIFLSKKVYKALAGWASVQIRSMKSGQTKGYMGHKRKELVQELGYDPKDASHAIRLLFTGLNFLRTGTLDVWMEGVQRDRILAVKRGEVELTIVKQLAEHLFNLAEIEFSRCELPEQPDHRMAEILLMEIQREALTR